MYLAVLHLSCGTWDLYCCWLALYLPYLGSRVPGLSCPEACEILVPHPGIEPAPCIGRQSLNH